MCTAITFKYGNNYFGRNLDLEYSHKEAVTITPRKFKFTFLNKPSVSSHYAMIGMAYVVKEYPLYYDATNEKGLSMAGLSFQGYASYKLPDEKKDNVAVHEFIPWVLGRCVTVGDAKVLLKRINLVAEDFREDLPTQPLHWIIADKVSSITVECTLDGMKIYDNPIGVLANNPTFDYHMTNLLNYINLTSKEPDNDFMSELELEPYSKGMGAVGLPGDYSSASRFVRAAFVLHNSVVDNSLIDASAEKHLETEDGAAVSQFFHILDSVAQPRGAVELPDGRHVITVYSSCCNQDTGVYYYKTYNNSTIRRVDMYAEDIEGDMLVSYPIEDKACFERVN